MTERENSRQAEVMRRERKKTILQDTDQNLEGLNLGLMVKKYHTGQEKKMSEKDRQKMKMLQFPAAERSIRDGFFSTEKKMRNKDAKEGLMAKTKE